MKTSEQPIIFHKEEVQKYIHMLSDPNPIYKSEVNAKQHGYKNIPVPPIMPVTTYQLFDIPWTMQSPVILRKQRCTMYEQMFIEEYYTGFISLTDIWIRKEQTFSKETLSIYNAEGILCFRAISQLLSGKVI